MNAPPSQIDLGGLMLTVVDGGTFRLDGAALYGIYPRVFWEKLNLPDEDHRVLLGLSPAIVTTTDGVVIIDPGIGFGWSPLATDRYDIRGGRTIEALPAEAGASPADVAGVIATHLHFDHAAGAVRLAGDLTEEQARLSDLALEGDEGLEPSLPGARLHVQQAELEALKQPDLRTASYESTLAAQVWEREGRLSAHEGTFELYPGVTVELTGGHTPGHQVVWLEGTESRFLLSGDLVPTTAHVRSEVVEGVDYEPAVTARKKAALLARAASAGAYLTFYHAPRVRWGRVRSGAAGTYQLEETHTVSSAGGAESPVG